MVPEGVCIRDLFANRMNTVFKFYYQAWLYLAVSLTGVLLLLLKTPRARLLSYGWIILLSSGLIYPIRAAYTLSNHFTPAERTLDGSAWIKRQDPELAELLHWISQHTNEDELFITPPGSSYNPLHSSIATFCGRPLLLGWTGHENQWHPAEDRPMIQQRERWLRNLYKTGLVDADAAAAPIWQQARYLLCKTTSPIRSQFDARYNPVYANTNYILYEK